MAELGGYGEALSLRARAGAGDAVVQAVGGVFESHPFEEAIFPVDFVFKELADGCLGGVAECGGCGVAAIFADGVFEGALAAVVVLVDDP